MLVWDQGLEVQKSGSKEEAGWRVLLRPCRERAGGLRTRRGHPHLWAGRGGTTGTLTAQSLAPSDHKCLHTHTDRLKMKGTLAHKSIPSEGMGTRLARFSICYRQFPTPLPRMQQQGPKCEEPKGDPGASHPRQRAVGTSSHKLPAGAPMVTSL